MKTYVDVGWSQEFKLAQVLLLFQKSDRSYHGSGPPFVTVHDAVHEKDGAVHVGAGHLLTPEALRELLAEAGHEATIEILPERVLARTPDVVVWWSPASQRRMFFSDRNSARAGELNAKEYPHPPLLWRANGRRIWLRALTHNQRPERNAQLYTAPYWNTYDNGSVCTGSMKIPESKGVSVIDKWEESFFRSAFTHAAGVTKHSLYPCDVLEMWKTLQGKQHFPVEYLAPAEQTLEDFVSSDDNTYHNRRRRA